MPSQCALHGGCGREWEVCACLVGLASWGRTLHFPMHVCARMQADEGVRLGKLKEYALRVGAALPASALHFDFDRCVRPRACSPCSCVPVTSTGAPLTGVRPCASPVTVYPAHISMAGKFGKEKG